MIIGLTGSFGAGKGVVVEYLKQKGFKHYSARDFIFEEAKRRGMDISLGREVTIPVANDLRKQHGPAYIVQQLYAKAVSEGGNAVIESLRAVAEAQFIKDNGGIVWGVDATPELRYQRSVERKSETDNVSFETWKEHEERETNPDDPTKQDLFGTLKISHTIFQNNGTLDELHAQVDRALSSLS